MEKLKIKDWEKWQSYRKDRGAPPWIKVHRNLLSNYKWASLTDAEKGQIVSLWITASDNNGMIPACELALQKICQLDSKPNLKKFNELGLFESCDAKLASSWRQHDVPETETETELVLTNYVNLEKNKKPAARSTSSKLDPAVSKNVQEIFDHWVNTMGKRPGATKLTPKRKRSICNRLKEGYTVDQIKIAIKNCSNDPFSMGQNNRGKSFNDIELICRSGEKLESFFEETKPEMTHGKNQKPSGKLSPVEQVELAYAEKREREQEFFEHYAEHGAEIISMQF